MKLARLDFCWVGGGRKQKKHVQESNTQKGKKKKFKSLITVSDTSNMRSSIWEKYKLAAIILASKHTSLVTSGVTRGFPAVHIRYILSEKTTIMIEEIILCECLRESDAAMEEITSFCH